MNSLTIENLNCNWEEGCEPLLTQGNSGIDLRAKQDYVIAKHDVYSIGTGFYVEIPEGFTGLLLPRSGSSKTGIKLANTVGNIDPTYRGEIKAKFVKDWQNYLNDSVIIEKGERICQLVIVPYLVVGNLNYTENLSDTDRGDTGFGDSGRF